MGKYVFEDTDTLIAHIVQGYDLDELSYLKLQSALYLSYAYYTKYYNIVKLEEPDIPSELFKANLVATEDGVIIEGIEGVLTSLFKNRGSHGKSRLLKENIKRLYSIDERILKNVDNVMMKIIDMSEDELIERICSDDSWNYAYRKTDNGVINTSHLAGEYNHKDEITLITMKEVFDYNSIL